MIKKGIVCAIALLMIFFIYTLKNNFIWQKNATYTISWFSVDAKISHYEVLYGEKGEFNRQKIVWPVDQKTTEAQIDYPKNKVLVASVRSCTHKGGCSVLPGFVMTGIKDHTINTEKCTFDGKTSLCKIYAKDDSGYILIDSDSLDPNTWDRVFYFEKVDEKIEIQEFKMDPDEKTSLSI